MWGQIGAAAVSTIPAILQYLTSGGQAAKPEQFTQQPRFNPQTLEMQNKLRDFAGNKLMGNQFDFAPIEAQARKGFQTQTVPSIMQRFASNENLGGSGLTSALGGASKDLEMGLAALKEQYGLQQQSILQNLLGMGMAPQYENIFRPEKPSDLQTMLAQLGQLGGQIGGAYFGGQFMQPDFWKQQAPQQQAGVPAKQVAGPYSEYPRQNVL